jgi:hypothetical protein
MIRILLNKKDFFDKFQVIGYSAKELNTLVIEAEQKSCGSITIYK